MKIKILLFFATSFLINTQIYSQSNNLVVEYDFRLILNNIKNYSAILIQNDSVSYFKYFNTESNDHLKEKNGNYNFSIGSKMENFIFSDKFQKLNLEIVKGFEPKKYYQIVDSLKNSDWEITEESKMIEGYKTLKALKKFKGREYLVWFTPDIPGYFGPLKLHGLPGLILEVSDSKKEIILIAKKILINKHFEKLQFPKVNYPQIRRMEYNQMVNKELEKLTQKMSSKLDRRFKVEIESSSPKSIEIEDQ